MEHEKFSGEATVQEAVKQVAAIMGENVRLRRGFLVSSQTGIVSSYLHASAHPGLLALFQVEKYGCGACTFWLSSPPVVRVYGFRFTFHSGLLEYACFCHQCTSHVTVGRQGHMGRESVWDPLGDFYCGRCHCKLWNLIRILAYIFLIILYNLRLVTFAVGWRFAEFRNEVFLLSSISITGIYR